MMLKMLRIEWIRLRIHWIGWTGLVANLLFLVWNLHVEHNRLMAHISSAFGTKLDLFWTGPNLLKFIITWAGQPTLAHVVIWAAVGALWSWNDWRPGLPTEHVNRIRLLRTKWSLSRLISLSLYIIMLQILYVSTAYAIALATRQTISWTPAGTTLWLLGLSALVSWTASVLGLLFMALWTNPILGTITVWVIWWLRESLQDRINQWLVQHVGFVVTWILTALDPINNVYALSSVWVTWGNQVITKGGWTSLTFVGNLKIGIPLGTRIQQGVPVALPRLYQPFWSGDLLMLLIEVFIAIFVSSQIYVWTGKSDRTGRPQSGRKGESDFRSSEGNGEEGL